MVRFGARDYEPETGSWLAKDPLLLSGGDENLYSYVGQEPLNNTDTSGLLGKQGCERLAEKIENVRKRIQRRIGQLDENPGTPEHPLGLPETCAGDKQKPSLSRAGHRRLINEDKALLAELEGLYSALCKDDDDSGSGPPPLLPSPSADPKKVPNAAPIAAPILLLIMVLLIPVGV